MPAVDLQPGPKTDEKFRSYLETQFRRVGDSIEAIPEIDYGILTVTGSVEIVTNVINVEVVVAVFDDPPVAGAAYLRAIPVNVAENRGSDFSNILIDVYTNGFALSSTPIRVSWIAVGSTKVE